MESHQIQLTSELIQQIYNSVSHPDGWTVTAEAIAHAMHAEGCSIWLSDLDNPDVHLTTSTIQDSALIEYFIANFAQDNPHFQRLQELPAERMYTSEQVMPRQEFNHTRMYKEFWRRANIAYSIGGLITRERRKVAMIQVWRGGEPPFDQRDVEMLEFLRPHLEQALIIRGELLRAQSRADTSMLALDRMEMAMILADAQGRPLAHNHRAVELQARGVFRLEQGGLHFKRAADNRRLAELLAGLGRDIDSASRLGGGFKLQSKSKVGEVEVLVMPYGGEEPSAESLQSPPVAVIFIKIVDAVPIPREQLLRDLYGMTVAELKVCLALLEGQTVKDIAEQQGISIDGVRFHCKNILRKTGSQRQVDLIRTLSQSIANLADD